MKIPSDKINDWGWILTEYQKRFGDPPFGEAEVGPDEYIRLLREAIETDTPAKDPFVKERAMGYIIY